MQTKEFQSMLNLSALIWIVLNLADACITLFAVEHGLAEISPIFSRFLGPELILIKFILAFVVLWGLYYFRKQRLLPFLNAGMGLILIWNLAATVIGG